MNFTTNNLLARISQFLIPALVLLNTYFFLFDVSNAEFFSQFTSIAYFHIFMVFLAVKSINALLIIFGHKKRKYFITLLWLLSVQYTFTYFYIGIDNQEGAKLLHQFFVLKWMDSFIINLIIDTLFLFFCFFIVIKEKSNEEMNRYFKILFYLFIPYIFYFTFSRSFSYINYDYCLSQFDQKGSIAAQELDSPLIGKKIDDIVYFATHDFDANKKYALYLMDSNCQRCWRGINNIKSLKSIGFEVIYFDVGENKLAIQEYALDEAPHYYTIPFSASMLNAFPDLPTTILIEKNQIQNLFFQSTPSTYELLY